jgi:hypothetical protein
MFVRFDVELPTFQCITTTVYDNNKQYQLYFSAAVVITNCVYFIVLARIFNAHNCTCEVFGRKLHLCHISLKIKLLRV